MIMQPQTNRVASHTLSVRCTLISVREGRLRGRRGERRVCLEGGNLHSSVNLSHKYRLLSALSSTRSGTARSAGAFYCAHLLSPILLLPLLFGEQIERHLFIMTSAQYAATLTRFVASLISATWHITSWRIVHGAGACVHSLAQRTHQPWPMPSSTTLPCVRSYQS